MARRPGEIAPDRAVLDRERASELPRPRQALEQRDRAGEKARAHAEGIAECNA